MVSVVVVGFPMSGKTTLVSALANLTTPRSGFRETCSCNFVGLKVNSTEWHVWDTPRVSCSDDISRAWIGYAALEEADVVVVCHDGNRNMCPMSLVRACGTDRCVIALTRGAAGREDMSYAIDYLRATCSSGALVPRTHNITQLMSAITHVLAKAGAMPTC